MAKDSVKIIFNAFGQLYFKLKQRGINPINAKIEVEKGFTVKRLIASYHLGKEEVEASFVNGRVASFDTPLKEGDRIALIPPGTPGPYRYLLGLRKKNP